MKTILPILIFMLSASAAHALPHYGAASAHTCGNCHVSPTYEDRDGWENPDLPLRKCNLSCSSCHVDPAGGALRNTSGRYFAASSLAIFPTQERSYSDVGHELFGTKTTSEFLRHFGEPVVRTSSRTIPSDFREVARGIGANQTGGWMTFGKPLGAPSEYSFWDGRYNNLNADPLLSFGGDLRAAYWSGSENVFPMQLDLDAALHPIEHVTAMATLAARGRVAGFTAVAKSAPSPVYLRNAFLLVHELPFMSYVKAGIFMPAFGTRIDDHTSFVRADFEQDFSASEDRVLGVEIGLAANYPYANASVFRGFVSPAAPEATGGGYGGALNLGWRGLGWSLGAHAMIKRRPLAARGDFNAAGISWVLSPYYWIEDLPLTILGEVSAGTRQRAADGATFREIALFGEAWWSLFNGVSLRGKYDFSHRELVGVRHRAGLGVDLAIVPGLDLFPQLRMLWDDQKNLGLDLFVQLHAYF